MRLEIWSTYAILLNQTTVYGGLPDSKDDASPRGKRKRDTETPMDVEETPYSLLKQQVPSLSKALLAQLKSAKTPPAVWQAGFVLLKALLTVLPGSLASQIPQIVSTSKTILSQPPSTSTSTLHITCLSFLSLFFATHSPSTFSSSLTTLKPLLLKATAERHPRIAAEAFRVFSSLLNAIRPAGAADWAFALYDQVLNRLSSHDTDADVRAAAEDCIADLWICATEVPASKDRKEWEYVCRTTGKSDGAVRVIAKVAQEVTVDEGWTNECVSWLMGLLKKSSGRTGKAEVFTGLQVLIKRYGLSASPLPNPALDLTILLELPATSPEFLPASHPTSFHKSSPTFPPRTSHYFHRLSPHFHSSSSYLRQRRSLRSRTTYSPGFTLSRTRPRFPAQRWSLFSGSSGPSSLRTTR